MTIPADKVLAMAINRLAERHGSLRAAARVLNVDAGYLSRLQSGEKDNPSDALLKKLKLKRKVTYDAIDRARSAK